jgi:hypothetical protein
MCVACNCINAQFDWIVKIFCLCTAETIYKPYNCVYALHCSCGRIILGFTHDSGQVTFLCQETELQGCDAVRSSA